MQPRDSLNYLRDTETNGIAHRNFFLDWISCNMVWSEY
jgi:hypothetical protein